MSMNLLRVSKADETPGFSLRGSTLYLWNRKAKHSELFVKLGAALFVNLEKWRRLSAGAVQRQKITALATWLGNEPISLGMT
jgi:hypothetical protein